MRGGQPAVRGRGETGRGGDEGLPGQARERQLRGRKGVDGTFHEQDRPRLVAAGGQPETTRGHALECTSAGQGPGVGELGVAQRAVAIAADEDGMAAAGGVEASVQPRGLHQGAR